MFCYKVNAIICRKVSHMSLKSEQLFHCDCVGRFLQFILKSLYNAPEH